MDAQFWHTRWNTRNIGFHEPKANPLLVQHITRFNLHAGARIFLPLCGKTRDIAWLLEAGYCVVGIELVQTAVEQLFEELGLSPIITECDSLTRYRARNIEIFVGDIFALTPRLLGHVDLIYDRAALVALPPKTRDRYTNHLRNLTGRAPQFLVTITYDQRLKDGPPFSVDEAEVTRHYQDHYNISYSLSRPADGKLKEQCAAMEHAVLLRSPDTA